MISDTCGRLHGRDAHLWCKLLIKVDEQHLLDGKL
jgi:hypothetical protein